MDYHNRIHRLGRISATIALLLIVSVPILISIRFNIFPPLGNLALGVATIWMLQFPVAIAEVLTYSPMMGSGASYLAFVTGNLSNLKVPCAFMAMDHVGVKPSSPQGDIISTVSVAVSSIVTIIVIVIGVLLIRPLTPLLESPALAPAFANILPALFGALGAYWGMKHWKLAVVPLTIVIVIYSLVDVNPAVLIPVCGLLSVLAARWMYNRGWVDADKEEAA